MNILTRILSVIRRIEEALMIVGLVVTVVLVLVAVFGRYVLGTGFLWGDEVVGFMLVLITMMGAAVGYRKKMHTSLDVFINKAHGPMKWMMKTIIGLSSVFFLVVLIYSGILLVTQTWGRYAITMNLNMGYIYILIPLGAALLLLEVILRIVSDLLTVRKGKEG